MSQQKGPYSRGAGSSNRSGADSGTRSGAGLRPADAGPASASVAASSSGGSAPPPIGAGMLPAVSLPRGGGALHGIGEKFATSPVTGTGSLTVPIATSPGRAGFDLALHLGYDSGGGNGSFGLGWHLSVPSITRKTDKGLPRYADAEASDVFVLSGAEDLVPVRVPDGQSTRLDIIDRGAFRVQRFRPRVE